MDNNDFRETVTEVYRFRDAMIIKQISEITDRVGDFINISFTDYAAKRRVELNFEEFCFVAEESGEIVGAITGRAYYNEVHIGDLIVGEKYRGCHIGSELIKAVEQVFTGKGYQKITLTTFGFQAPEFYRKLGYEVEFVRDDDDPKLRKYFYIKKL